MKYDIAFTPQSEYLNMQPQTQPEVHKGLVFVAVALMHPHPSCAGDIQCDGGYRLLCSRGHLRYAKHAALVGFLTTS